MAPLALSAGCIRYDAPRKVIEAPGAQTWGVGLSRSGSAYKVTSTTRLNGKVPLSEKPMTTIDSGTDGDWTWSVKAAPSVIPSWNAWLADKKTRRVRQEAQRSGNWTQGAAGWDLAFQRAHRVARYLLGHEPPALHLTLLLLPDDVQYSHMIVRTGNGYLPLTLAFYWPPSGGLKEFSALVSAVARTMYEYQHLLVDTNTIQAAGASEGDKTTNDEARSQCWYDSTFLALSAGTHTTVQWKAAGARAAAELLQQSTQYNASLGQSSGQSQAGRAPIPFAEAVLWGRFFEIESLDGYLKRRGIAKARVEADRPEEVNAVLSVCRATTQHPMDVTTTNGYPPSQVEYVPFFSAGMKGYKPKPGPGEK